MFDEINKARIKDNILKSVLITHKNTHKIAAELGQHIHLISYLVEELRDDGLVKLTIVTSKLSSMVADEYFVTITNKGNYFLSFDGGHSRLTRKALLNTAWMIAKTFAVISNALIIIYLTYLSVSKP